MFSLFLCWLCRLIRLFSTFFLSYQVNLSFLPTSLPSVSLSVCLCLSLCLSLRLPLPTPPPPNGMKLYGGIDRACPRQVLGLQPSRNSAIVVGERFCKCLLNGQSQSRWPTLVKSAAQPAGWGTLERSVALLEWTVTWTSTMHTAPSW